jgi:hypothetical protein
VSDVGRGLLTELAHAIDRIRRDYMDLDPDAPRWLLICGNGDAPGVTPIRSTDLGPKNLGRFALLEPTPSAHLGWKSSLAGAGVAPEAIIFGRRCSSRTI